MRYLKEHKDMIERVRMIDRGAAEYLDERLEKGGYAAQHLHGCFVWSETVGGHAYWSNLSRQVDTDSAAPRHRTACTTDIKI